MIAFEKLAALALNELTGDELDAVELHVLACSSCAQTLTQLVKLGDAVRELSMSGKLRMFVGQTTIARLNELGLISRRYELSPNQVVPCGVAHDDVYALVELKADLQNVTRVDLVSYSHAAGEVRTQDVPFDAVTGTVAFIQRADIIRMLPTSQISLRLLDVQDTHERVLAEYVLDHHATP